MQYFDVAQTAKKLGISTSTVYRLIETGKIRAGRFGLKKGYRISEKEMQNNVKSLKGIETKTDNGNIVDESVQNNVKSLKGIETQTPHCFISLLSLSRTM